MQLLLLSLITGTGYVVTDFDQWPDAIRLLLVAVMFFGGCAGSTTGSIENYENNHNSQIYVKRSKSIYETICSCSD